MYAQTSSTIFLLCCYHSLYRRALVPETPSKPFPISMSNEKPSLQPTETMVLIGQELAVEEYTEFRNGTDDMH